MKDAIQAKKVAYKTWFQNRVESSLLSRYTEAPTSAALVVKKSKMQSWKNLGHQLHSNFWQALGQSQTFSFGTGTLWEPVLQQREQSMVLIGF